MNKAVPHNLNYKSVSVFVSQSKGRCREIVYSIDNVGNDEGLEVFYRRSATEAPYRSIRFAAASIPKKYSTRFQSLKSKVGEVPNGHKLTITQNQQQ